MRKAIELARSASAKGDVPVGAVVVVDGAVRGVGFNQKEANHDPTAHAEIVALRQAAARCGGWRLTNATLFVTKEPCVMCAGACVAARIERLVYACSDPKGGGAGSVFDLTNSDRLNHRMIVEKGVLEEESAALLRDFFKNRRESTIEY
jgi:tRNA(adenine34) deaminase